MKQIPTLRRAPMLGGRFLILLLALAISGCAARGSLTFLEQATAQVAQLQPANQHEIFVATTRTPDIPSAGFSSERSTGITYARYTVSVPDDHAPGDIEWPTGTADPKRDFVTVDVDDIADGRGLVSAIDQRLAERPADEREIVVFTHGYNNNFAESLYRFTQIVHDFNLRGIAVHYSWPSAGTTRGYAYDRDSANISRDALETLLGELAGSNASRILLVGHSLGAHLVVETLRQVAIKGDGNIGRKLKGVILLSPDIDEEVFRAQVRRIDPLPRPFVIFVSGRDRALKLSALLTGKKERLGSLSNVQELEGLDIIVIDVSRFDDGDSLNHLTAVTSPAMIALINNLPQSGAALKMLEEQSN